MLACAMCRKMYAKTVGTEIQKIVRTFGRFRKWTEEFSRPVCNRGKASRPHLASQKDSHTSMNEEDEVDTARGTLHSDFAHV